MEAVTEFKFADLSEPAKEAARQKAREYGLDYEWWEYTYDDAKTVAVLLGIEIPDNENISFSGFSQQGDGASFRGRYHAGENEIAKVAAHAPLDTVLGSIAQELTALRIGTYLRYGEKLEAIIAASGHYSNSGSMVLASAEPETDLTDDTENELLALMRRFADWIYGQLRNEYDHLVSDESIDGGLDHHTFDESGAII